MYNARRVIAFTCGAGAAKIEFFKVLDVKVTSKNSISSGFSFHPLIYRSLSVIRSKFHEICFRGWLRGTIIEMCSFCRVVEDVIIHSS